MKPRTTHIRPFLYKKLAKTLIVFLLLSGFTTPWSKTWAQSGPTGTLTGAVTDQTGALVAGAAVTITNAATKSSRSVTTDHEGRWKVTALDVGTYTLVVETTGFKKAIAERVEVEAAVPRTVDIKLEPGAIQEAVNIVAGSEVLQRETATTFRQLNSLELQEVPSSTRSFTHLLSAEAGVSADLPPVLTNSNGNLSPSVNGLRPTSNSLQFNGVDTTNITSNEGSLTDNISPAPETLQEVKLQTSLYDASTGRSGGGNFQLITKSGGNDFHGSLYWFLQNEKFNANDFFYNKDGINRPVARRNEGGFAIGGPIIKERSFFFGSYQRTQAKTGFVPTAQSITLLPRALDLVGTDRSAAALISAFKQLNPGFNLNASQVSRFALNLLNLKNPATGGFIIPAPSSLPGVKDLVDANGVPLVDLEGNPLARLRQVFPAEFEQDQFTLRNDTQLTTANKLAVTFFFSNFPGLDPFPDPSSLASPFTLERNDRARALSVSDIHLISSRAVNEARFGYFKLNNTRQGAAQFDGITSESVLEGTGVPIQQFNPSVLFDDSLATRRLGHYTAAPNFNFSFGYPNDSYNTRKQQTYTLADILSYTRGAHTLRLGGEYKRHFYDTSLPEEQQTEFEKQRGFTSLLRGLTTEGDTQFGITEKNFRMHDLSWFVADDWKVSRRLTLNAGLRWDWFAWPTEKNGRIGNVDFEQVGPNLLPSAFIVPKNVKSTGFGAIDATVATAVKIDNNHTLKGEDLNNFQPRLGFAWTPFDSSRLVVRGGYGIFFDRPSAAFVNTIFSNYPFLREIEVTAPSNAVPFLTAFSQQNPNLPFSQFLPFRIILRSGVYEIRDNTGVTRGADGTLNANDPATGQPTLGNIAETFEFRAIDRGLRTPYIQQWNLGFQHELAKNLLIEARYVGTKGTKLLQALAFNQPFDLNDPSTPDYIYQRFVDAYVAAGSPRGALNAGSTARARGLGKAFGFTNPLSGQIDLNFSQPVALVNGQPNLTQRVIIPFEARGVSLGFNIPEALLLTSSGNSTYHGLQLGLMKRMSNGLQFNAAYTFSKSMDTSSSDPGSTAGGGKPDVPNVGFVLQGNQRDVRSSRALSDYDRPHRVSLSFVYNIPSFGSDSRLFTGWQIASFIQAQSGTPFSIFTSEPEARTLGDLLSLNLGAGGLYRLGFGRPSLKPGTTLDDLRRTGADPTEAFFNKDVLASPLGGFGNIGRNVLRGPNQKRFDVSLSKTTRIVEDVNIEFRWEVFNLFNNVNFATPNNDLQDRLDLGTITNTVGGPRVMQFGLKLRF
ncbi:MAG: TonB-dependent receptor [Acidobacteriota bacterium]